MTIFGPDLEKLELADLQAYLDEADAEPLVWEAKGTSLDKGEIRAQVCGFANSHDGGYLILGVDREGGRWACNGVGFPGAEPTTWLTDIVCDDHRGVRPRPDIAFSRVLAAPEGSVVVVRVWPTATPPCIANGTVYERLPGKTVPVRDPHRLASMYERGDAARSAAEAKAVAASEFVRRRLLDRAAKKLVGREEGARLADCPRFAFAAAATGYPADISSRLFQEGLATELWNTLQISEPGMPPGYGPQAEPVRWSQDALVWEASQHHPIRSTTFVRASWDGTVTMGRIYEPTNSHADAFAREACKAWSLLDRVMRAHLGGFGDVYAVLAVGGRALLGKAAPDPVVMTRGPLAQGIGDDDVASLERELMRAVGTFAPEPAREPGICAQSTVPSDAD